MLAHDLTIPPAKAEDREKARISAQKLAKVAQEQRAKAIHLRERGKESVLELPADVFNVLMTVLDHIAAGRPVTVMPRNAEMTTQEAADFLNVSRPYLIGLLEKKKLAHRMVGTHRRILFEDLMAYKQKEDTRRRKVLDQMVADAQKLGLGY